MESIALRSLYDTFEAVQKIRIAAENRLRAAKQMYDENHKERLIIMQQVKNIEVFENVIVKQAEEILNSLIIYDNFLNKVNGISVRTSLRLLSLGLDINKELSDWYAYFGLVPIYWACECERGHKILLPKDPFLTGATCIQNIKIAEKTDIVTDEDEDEEINPSIVKRVKMEKCGAKIIKSEPCPPKRKRDYYQFWNPRAKKTAYIITDYWVKNPQKSFYGLIFKKEREKLMQRKDANGVYFKEIKDKIVATRRATLSARRKAFKLFLAHMYQAWRELLGMEYRMPYAFEFLKHDDFISWKEVLTIEESLKNKKKASIK